MTKHWVSVTMSLWLLWGQSPVSDSVQDWPSGLGCHPQGGSMWGAPQALPVPAGSAWPEPGWGHRARSHSPAFLEIPWKSHAASWAGAVVFQLGPWGALLIKPPKGCVIKSIRVPRLGVLALLSTGTLRAGVSLHQLHTPALLGKNLGLGSLALALGSCSRCVGALTVLLPW